MDKKTEIKQNEEEKNILLISEVNEQRWPPFTCTIETQHQRAGCFHVVPQWMRTASCSPVRDRSGKSQEAVAIGPKLLMSARQPSRTETWVIPELSLGHAT